MIFKNKLRHYRWLMVFLPVWSVFAITTCENKSGEQREGQIWSVTRSPDSTSIRVHDMLGRQITLPKKIERVVCLRAGALRLLVYLDASHLAVGIEEAERRSDRTYMLAQPQLQDLPVIGPQMGGDAELITAARPEVIFMTFTTRAQADRLQKRTGIPVVALQYGDFSGQRKILYQSMELMASILGKEERAAALITYIEDSIRELEQRTREITHSHAPRVYIGGVSYRGARGITSTEPHYPPFAFVNAENVAAQIHPKTINPIQGTYIDKEQLILWNPETLFVDLFSQHLVRPDLQPGSPLSGTLSALQKGEVYGLLSYNNYATNYETLLVNAWYVGKVLYPEAFEDIRIPEKADEIFETFLGDPVYHQIAASEHGGFRKLAAPMP